MRAFLIPLTLLCTLSIPVAGDREIRSARTGIIYVYEIDDAALPVEPVVLGGEQTGGLAAIGRAVADATGAPGEAVHLRAASFWVSFRYDATLDSAPLRLCRFHGTGQWEVVLDGQLPDGGATVLVPYEDASYRLVMALRIDRTDPDRIIEIQERLGREIEVHAEKSPGFPPALVHRVQECPDVEGSR